jgi:hypothetical protein
MVEKNVTEEETEVKVDEFEALGATLKTYGVPDDAIAALPEFKKRYGKFRVAYLGSNVYIYKRLTWGEMKEITNKLSNFAKGPNASEATLRIADLELQLEKAILYPSVTPDNASRYPSGDLETLQALITEFSGYVDTEPVVEDY